VPVKIHAHPPPSFNSGFEAPLLERKHLGQLKLLSTRQAKLQENTEDVGTSECEGGRRQKFVVPDGLRRALQKRKKYLTLEFAFLFSQD
jgi:hypothetical protein